MGTVAMGDRKLNMAQLRAILIATVALAGFCIASGAADLLLGDQSDTIELSVYIAMIAGALPIIVYSRFRRTKSRGDHGDQESKRRVGRAVLLGAMLATVVVALTLRRVHRV